MNAVLSFKNDFLLDAISPIEEMGAYEYLWDQQGSTFKRLSDLFKKTPGGIPSDLVDGIDIQKYIDKTLNITEKNNIKQFGVRVHGAGEYPQRLQDAKNPVELLYYQGVWAISDAPSIAIVGSRKASNEGLRRAAKVAKIAVENNITVVSGLAEGIDGSALRAAQKAEGRLIAVIGTPLSEKYPRSNESLQDWIRDNQLLISPVPFCRYYKKGGFNFNRSFFPERNAVMSALTQATVIVEAGESSGTLTQARAALYQGRKLFILNSCFENKNITWPALYEKKGAIRIRDFEELIEHLVQAN